MNGTCHLRMVAQAALDRQIEQHNLLNTGIIIAADLS
jgi:hypothetical protein